VIGLDEQSSSPGLCEGARSADMALSDSQLTEWRMDAKAEN